MRIARSRTTGANLFVVLLIHALPSQELEPRKSAAVQTTRMSDSYSGAEVAFSEGDKASAEDGVVMLDGPDGVAISMTSEAAEQTGSSLLDAAREARGQHSAQTDISSG